MVSVGDKTLPHNPTAQDRHDLLTTLSARIVQQPLVRKQLQHQQQTTGGGIKTILPRRRPSTDDLYRPASSGRSATTMTVKYAAIPNNQVAATNSKRSAAPQMIRAGSQDAKRSRTGVNSGKKLAARASPVKQRQLVVEEAVAEETDTIDKRNQHNDMERQRRIGLKNLFEELKYQIPSLKDKERAPKVSILREASNLCKKYQREEEEMQQLAQRHAQRAKYLKSLKLLVFGDKSRQSA